jgi:hypothetical protein
MLGPKATQAHVPSVKMVADPKVLQAGRNPTGSALVVGSRPVARLSALLPGNGLQVVGSSVHRVGTAAVEHRHAAVAGVAHHNSDRRAGAVRRAVVETVVAGAVRRAVVVVHRAAVVEMVAAVRRAVAETVVGNVAQTTATGVPALAPVAVVLGVGHVVVRMVVRHPVGSAV